MESLSQSLITINLRVTDGAVTGLMIGGNAIVHGTLAIEIPTD